MAGPRNKVPENTQELRKLTRAVEDVKSAVDAQSTEVRHLATTVKDSLHDQQRLLEKIMKQLGLQETGAAAAGDDTSSREEVAQVVADDASGSENVEYKFEGCASAQCHLCKDVLTQKELFNIATYFSEWPRGTFKCDSENVVYAAVCIKCTEMGIGHTTRTLRDAVSDWRQRYGGHSSRCGTENMKFLPIEKVEDEQEVEEKKKFWIKKVKKFNKILSKKK